MFDKLKYNNLIISGSKEIQKAKIQVLRKIIQKIQKLKKLAEKRPDNESCKIKLRKCLEVVESAKKIKKFEALTNILMLEKSPNKIVTNSQSTPEEVAIAMLASNPTMKTLLTKIREELSLKDDDFPTWRKTLAQISKQKIKTQRRKKRKLAFEASGAEPEKKNPKLKNKTKKGKAASNENPDVLTTNMDEHSAQEISTIENENETPKKKSKIQKIKIKSPTSENTAENSSNENKKLKPERSLIVNKNKAPENFKSLSNGLENYYDEKELNKSNNFKTEDSFIPGENKTSRNFTSLNSEIKNNSRKTHIKSQPEIKISKVVDPFFVTSTGENYVAIAPAIETNDEVTESSSSFKEKKKDSNEKFKDFKPENQKIHPSWAAKQKQRTPVGFQGKRKVFDDIEKSKSNDSTGNMHPSWVAKQKLKPTITAFQGKKIKFDDD